MGVASSDAEYLKQVERPVRPAHPRSSVPGEGEPQKLHYSRYLSTPSSHKTIFIARQERARRRTRILLVALLVIVTAFIVWLLIIR